MLHKVKSLFFAVAFVLSCASLTMAEELTMTGLIMDSHPAYSSSVVPLFSKVKELSGGKLNVAYFNPGTICPEPEIYNSLVKGVVDIAQFAISRVPQKFVGTSVLELPLLFSSSRSASATALKLTENNEVFKKENGDLILFRANGTVPSDLLTIKPVKSLEDLKGKKIAVASATGVEVLKLLGATPVVVNVVDTYMSLQRGMVDGVLLPIPNYKSLKLTEVAKNLTKVSFGVAYTPSFINKKSYDKLSPESQKAINTIFGGPSTFFNSSVLDLSAENDLDFLIKNTGLVVHTLSLEEKARWEAALAPRISTWLENAKKAGIDGDALLAKVRELAAYYNNIENFQKEFAQYEEALGGLYTAVNK